MTESEEIMIEELHQFYLFDDEYRVLKSPENGVMVVAHEWDSTPMTVVVLDNLVNKSIVKWGVLDTGQHRDNMVWSVETEELADDFVEKNPTWIKVRRLIIDTGWTDI